MQNIEMTNECIHCCINSHDSLTPTNFMYNILKKNLEIDYSTFIYGLSFSSGSNMV